MISYPLSRSFVGQRRPFERVLVKNAGFLIAGTSLVLWSGIAALFLHFFH